MPPRIRDATVLLCLRFSYAPEVCRQGQNFFVTMPLLSGLSVCHCLSKFHPWPGWSHPKLSYCQMNPTHRKGICLLVFQQKSSRGEGLPTLLAFKLHLELVELCKMCSLPDQVRPAFLHAANGWYERSGTTPSLIHTRLKVSIFILSSPLVCDNGHWPHFSSKMWSCMAQPVLTTTWHRTASSPWPKEIIIPLALL